MGSLAFWLILGYMVAAHTYKMYQNFESGKEYHEYPIDFTGSQMVLTMKLTAFAYNVADGANFKANDSNNNGGKSSTDDVMPPDTHNGKPLRRSLRNRSVSRRRSQSPSSNKEVNVIDADAKKIALKEKIEASRRSFALQRLPSLLEFLGYVYCFTTIMVGPTFEYVTYEKCICGENQEKRTSPNSKKVKDKVATYTGPGFNTPLHGIMESLGKFFNCNMYVASIHRLTLALICIAGHMIMKETDMLGDKYASYKGYDNDWLKEHPNHFKRYWFMFVCMFAERLKFYFIWKAAEGACILAGFGFSGYDEEGNSKGYRAAENMDILGHEIATSVQILSRGWNQGTQKWLERYTFHRYNRSLIITYFISAIWHGVYPGFLVMFMSVPILTTCERLFQAKINPLVVPEYDGRNLATYPTHTVGYLYWFACMIGMKVSMNYLTQTFSMGWWENTWRALSSYNHYPHVIWLVIILILQYGFKTPKNKTK